MLWIHIHMRLLCHSYSDIGISKKLLPLSLVVSYSFLQRAASKTIEYIFFILVAEPCCHWSYSEGGWSLWLQNCGRGYLPPDETERDRCKQEFPKCLHSRNEGWRCWVWGEWSLCNRYCGKHWWWQGKLLFVDFILMTNLQSFFSCHCSHTLLNLQPKLIDEKQTTVYKKDAAVNYQLKMKASRFIISEVKEKFPHMPFTARCLLYLLSCLYLFNIVCTY